MCLRMSEHSPEVSTDALAAVWTSCKVFEAEEAVKIDWGCSRSKHVSSVDAPVCVNYTFDATSKCIAKGRLDNTSWKLLKEKIFWDWW